MKTFAEIINNIVCNIIIGTESHISTLPGVFVEVTNSTGNAVIGGNFREDLNKFISMQPYPSWTLDASGIWNAPSPKPAEGISSWDEENGLWVDLTPVEIELPNE
jgi:hypothetical protein